MVRTVTIVELANQRKMSESRRTPMNSSSEPSPGKKRCGYESNSLPGLTAVMTIQ